jgi:hypothetical protein
MLGFINFLKKKDNSYLDVSRTNFSKQAGIRKSFHQQTNKNVSDEDVPAVRDYLASSENYEKHYRGKSNPEIAEKAKRIEGVIKKTKTPRNLVMYRGFQSEDDIKPGTEIRHHSITSYGGGPQYSDMYRDKTRQNHVIRLKVPEGSHAAYIEHISQERHFKFPKSRMENMYEHGGEENWVLHPGARVKITASKKAPNGDMIHDAELVHDGVSNN